MIQPNQLRIGNKIQDKHGFVFDVVGIGETWVTADFEGNEGDVWEFDFKHSFPFPVHLTDNYLPAIDSGWRLEKTRHGRYNVWIGGNYLNTVEFVHEYQNLVFAITGRELEVKI